MSTHKRCSKHKYIGTALAIVREKQGAVVECFHCHKTYFSDQPISITTLSRRILSLCSHCKGSICCSRCGKKIIANRDIIAECVSCAKISLLCKKCSKNILILPSREELQHNDLGKLSTVVERLMHEIMESEEMYKLLQHKHKKFLAQSPLVFFFNIMVPEITGEINEENYNDNEEHGDDKGW